MLDHRLQVFRAVAEKLNFTRAARALHLSQSAVSQQIKSLEDELAVALFRRLPQGIVLTPQGHLLLEHALRVAEMTRSVELALQAEGGPFSGILRCGASTTIGQYLLPRLVGKFLGRHPTAGMTLAVGNTEEMVGALVAGRIDSGFIEGRCGRPDVAVETFFTDELVCVAAPGHPLAKAGEVSKADLRSAAWIVREPGSGTREVTDRALAGYGVDPKSLTVWMEVTYSESMKALVETGAGIAFLSRWVIRKELAAGSLQVLPLRGLAVRRPLSLIYPRGPRPMGLAGAFFDFVGEAMKEMEDGADQLG